LFERAKHFLDTDPDLADITHHFTRGMFTITGIEVLGTPVGNDRFIQIFAVQNCLKIMGDIGKHACLTDGFVHPQLLKFFQKFQVEILVEFQQNFNLFFCVLRYSRIHHGPRPSRSPV
jgi:hypothetical protein